MCAEERRGETGIGLTFTCISTGAVLGKERDETDVKRKVFQVRHGDGCV